MPDALVDQVRRWGIRAFPESEGFGRELYSSRAKVIRHFVHAAVVADRASGRVRSGQYGRLVRLIVARCEVNYTGRAAAFLPAAVRLVMIKADGTVMIWDDSGSYKVKPLN